MAHSSPEVLTYYARRIGADVRHTGRHKQVIKFPRRFSFLDAPELTLKAIKRFLVACLCSGTQEVELDQHDCTEVDYGAVSVANVIALQASKRPLLAFSGRLPRDRSLAGLVWATGLPKTIGNSTECPDGFLGFDLVRGQAGPELATESTAKETVATRITEYVDQCLNKHGSQLTREGMAYLAELVGEVLANSEDHSGRPDWWVAGFLRRLPHTDQDEMHMTFFNFGKTIYESLQELPPESLLRRDIDALVAKHTQRSLFALKRWTPEDLFTVYALQEGVSRFNTEPGELGTRGQGTVRIIKFFQDVGGSTHDMEPKMCLLSGSCYISIDRRYAMRLQRTGSHEQRAIIAFNRDNDLAQRPDATAVRHLREFFPGTLVGLRFYLDPAYLRRAT